MIGILNQLNQNNIKIKIIGNNNLWLGPKDKLTPELITKVKQHKEALIKTLQSQGKSKAHICQHCTNLRSDGYCPHWKQYPNEYAPIYSCQFWRPHDSK